MRGRTREDFYCGILLGGCGKQLTAKRYLDKKCHFAHRPPVHCRRTRTGEDSADHLYIGQALRQWLGQLGHRDVGLSYPRPRFGPWWSCRGAVRSGPSAYPCPIVPPGRTRVGGGPRAPLRYARARAVGLWTPQRARSRRLGRLGARRALHLPYRKRNPSRLRWHAGPGPDHRVDDPRQLPARG
ncbi:competence protein CoiA family protein [Streptomyces mutabilis]|uniref:competence protein CoiA family protein n=1 Tax=Streptomyces mutabilis TaxID=67332 RepID=UPI00344A9B85